MAKIYQTLEDFGNDIESLKNLYERRLAEKQTELSADFRRLFSSRTGPILVNIMILGKLRVMNSYCIMLKSAISNDSLLEHDKNGILHISSMSSNPAYPTDKIQHDNIMTILAYEIESCKEFLLKQNFHSSTNILSNAEELFEREAYNELLTMYTRMQEEYTIIK